MSADTPREALLREEGDVILAQLRKDQAALETVRAELEAAQAKLEAEIHRGDRAEARLEAAQKAGRAFLADEAREKFSAKLDAPGEEGLELIETEPLTANPGSMPFRDAPGEEG